MNSNWSRAFIGRLGAWARAARGTPNRREGILVAVLVLLLAGWAGTSLLEMAVVAPRRQLDADLKAAAEQLRHQEIMLSRAAGIEARYRALEAPGADRPDSALTETAVLRELSRLAGDGVHVRSVVPRAGSLDGQSALVVALDCEGSLDGIASYLAKVLARMPGEVGRLSLAPSPGTDGDVFCRLSLKVVGLGT